MRAKRSVAAVAPLLLIGWALPGQQQRINLETTAEPGQTLELDLSSVTGSIEIVGGAGNEVSINGTVSAREWQDDSEVIVDQGADGIRLYSEYLESRSGSSNRRRLNVDLRIRVPARFDIELSGAMDVELRDMEGRFDVSIGNNDIEASGLSGEARMSVANGNLRINDSDLDGRLSNTNGSLSFTGGAFHGELQSTNGGAEIDAVSGDLRISATNGSVRLGDVAGSLRGQSTNGNVEARLVGGEIDIQTTNGAVSATLAGDQSVRIETVNGDVELDAPADLSARFDIEVRQSQPERNRDRPEIRSDFALDVEAGSISGREYRQAASGTTGGGDQRIEVQTMNGDVVIRRSR